MVEIIPLVLEKKMKMGKVYNNNDDEEQRQNVNQKNSVELKCFIKVFNPYWTIEIFFTAVQ